MPMPNGSDADAGEAVASKGASVGHPAVPQKPVLVLEACLMVVLASQESGRSRWA